MNTDIKKTAFVILGVIIGLFYGGATAFAATEYATNTVSFIQGNQKGGNPVDASRSDPTAALGAPDGNFVSLGFGGQLDLEFADYMGGTLSISVQEVTGGSYPEELADVYVSDDNATWTKVGTASNELGLEDGLTTFDLQGMCVKYVRLVDVTNPDLHTSTADGFDVDAVIGDYSTTCEPQEPNPEPSTPLNIFISNHNFGDVSNWVKVKTNTGKNDANGGDSGDGGNSGSLSGNDNNNNTIGSGGSSLAGGRGGIITSGDATSAASIGNLVNENLTEVDPCGCLGSDVGTIMVTNHSIARLHNGTLLDADTGKNDTNGGDSGSAGSSGSISGNNHDSNTIGAGGAAGGGGSGGSITSGSALSVSSIMSTVNENITRIMSNLSAI